jgi:hypothetical protein
MSYVIDEPTLRATLDDQVESGTLVKLISERMPMECFSYSFSYWIVLTEESDFLKYCDGVYYEGLPTWSETLNESWRSFSGIWLRKPKKHIKFPTDSENPTRTPSESTTTAVSTSPARSYSPSVAFTQFNIS